MRAPKLIRIAVYPDWLTRAGWRLSFLAIPAPELMGRAEIGRRVLAGLGIDILFGWSDHQIAEGRLCWPRFRLEWWSDAGEIARRRAAAMGWPALV